MYTDNYPAVKAILHAVYEGLQLPMDLALRVEPLDRELRPRVAAQRVGAEAGDDRVTIASSVTSTTSRTLSGASA